MTTIEKIENIPKDQERNCDKEVEKTVDHYLIVWTIDDFLKVSEFIEPSVASPSFQIHSESWVIIIYPEILCSKEKVIKICLRREDTGNKLCSVIVTYRFGIKKQVFTWFEERRKINFFIGSCDSIVCYIPDYFASIDELKINTLTVVCEMYITYSVVVVQTIERFKNREQFDLRNLSLDLRHRCEKSQEFDVLIRRGKLKDIPAHKAIISARSPTFAQLIKNPSTSSIDIPEEDYDHIKNILLYIYSGRFFWVANSGIYIGLHECAQRYQLKTLADLLSPSEISIHSVIKEYNINFKWEIKNFSTLNLKRDECLTSVPMHAGYRDSPTWYLDIYPDGCSRSPKNIGIFVRTKDLKNIASIKLCVSVLDDFDKKYFEKRSCEPLFPDFVYGFPDFIRKEELQDKGLLLGDKLIVNCKICYGMVLHSFEETKIVSRSSYFEYPCLEQLSADLKKLLHRGDFSDATVVGDSCIFRVHKVIMSSRSSILDLLFKTNAKEDGVIGMEGFPTPVLEAFITYAYTGKWIDTDKHLIVEMYTLAKQYGVMGLVISCSLILTQTLNNKNICDVLLLAKRYKDKVLIVSCCHYLKKTGKELFETMEWKTLSGIETDLSLKIEKWLHNPEKDIPDI